MKYCDPCETALNKLAVTKKWRDIPHPLVLCQTCKASYKNEKDKPFKPKRTPLKRCMLCGKRKSAYDYWETEIGEVKPVCRKCHDLYYEVKE